MWTPERRLCLDSPLGPSCPCSSTSLSPVLSKEPASQREVLVAEEQPNALAFFVHTGPYYCARDHFPLSISECAFAPELIPLDKLVNLTKLFAANGDIDSTSYLENSRVFLISGTKDIVVAQGWQPSVCV